MCIKLQLIFWFPLHNSMQYLCNTFLCMSQISFTLPDKSCSFRVRLCTLCEHLQGLQIHTHMSDCVNLFCDNFCIIWVQHIGTFKSFSCIEDTDWQGFLELGQAPWPLGTAGAPEETRINQSIRTRSKVQHPLKRLFCQS